MPTGLTRLLFRTLGLLCLFSAALPLWAATYTSTSETYSWVDPSAHTNVSWTAASGVNACSGTSAATDDDITANLALGFTFPFATGNYTNVRIMSNGRIQFNNNTYCGYGTQSSGPPRTYPYPMPDSRLNTTMRIYGGDLDPSAGGNVRYASLGTSPNRSFVVTWTNVPEWSAGGSSFNLQIILYESGEFVYQYGSITNATLGQAQIGWQFSNNDYQMHEYTSATALQNTAIRFVTHTPTAMAYYAFDELSWNGTANEVLDTSGNNNHGSRVGSAQTISPGYICRGGNFRSNGNSVNTGVDVNSIGNRGTISFWYNSDSNWTSANTMLVDASSNLGGSSSDKYFFVTQRFGRIYFRLEASNDVDLAVQSPTNFLTSNTWHHIAITWDVVNDADWMQVYVNGTRQATNRGNTNAPFSLSNALGSLNTLYVGDNRTSGVSGGNYTTNNADGLIDEVRIYSDVLSNTQITTDMNQTHECLLAAWNMDETAWDGTANEVTDASGNGYHGTSANGATTSISNPAISTNPGTCYYGSFDGSNDYVALNNFPNLTDSFTFTAWINANDIGNDQRIFADDQNNSGGYAFSLGDGGNGRLRFFSRNISPVSLDTGAVITAGTWYHVAIVHNATANTRQIFVNGVAVTSAQSYTGTWGTDSGAASIGGENNSAGSEAVANWRFDGSIDEVRVYGRAMNAADITNVMNLTRACPVTFDHLRIEHDGTALTCEPETVTVRACLNSSCSTEYTGDVTVTLTPSGWTGGDTQTVSGGSTDFVLQRTSAGAVTLGISTPSPSPNNGIQCLNTATSSTSCSLTYYDTGFIYTIPTQTSCTTSNNITISAVRSDDTSQACVPTFVGQTRNVVFSLAYANPSTGTQDLTLNYNSTNYTPIDNSTSQTVPISFDSNGQATFTITYPDAGQITLNSLYTGSAGTGDAGLSMNGATTFVTKPHKLYVFSDDTNASCPAASATCSAFVRANEAFNLKVRGACADNSVTPNFQLSNLTLTHTNVAPAIAQGSLAVSSFDIVAADNGEHTISTQAVSEVGAFTFTAALPGSGYFGETIGNTTLNTSDNIGRFYPSHFCIGTPTLTNRTDANTASTCTDNFNYLDEDFTLSIPMSAQNFGSGCASSGITQNYSGSWSKFSSPFSEDTTVANESGKWNFAAANNPSGTPTNLNTRLNINTASSTGSFTNGQATLSSVMQIDRSGSAPGYTAETPFSDMHVGFNPVDTDGVLIDSTDLSIGGNAYRDLGNTILYFGRLFSENAFGTNQTDVGLDMYAKTEYCNAVSSGSCTQWLHNTADSCSLYNINPPSGTALGETTGGDGLGYYQRASAATSSGIFDFDDDGSAPSYARVHVPDTSDHSAGWRLFCDGCGDGGNYTIPFLFPFNTDTSVHPYLLHVEGIATFGQFRGDDRIIYWREILE